MYEYAVVIRKQKRGQPAIWQVWVGDGLVHEAASFLAVMNWAGARGFEAFAAGNFDELGVPEVLMKRSLALPPPPPLAKTKGTAGKELSPATEKPKKPAAKRAQAPAGAAKKGAKKGA